MVKIQLLNKLGKIQRVVVGRSSLKNYVKFLKSANGRVTWVRKETLELLKKKALRSKGYKEEKGRTEILGKTFVRYKFSLWRRPLNTTADIPKLFEKLEQRFKKIKSFNKDLTTQRIGVTIATDPKTFDFFTNSKTHRKNKKEVVDFISTTTYRRNEPSTIGMFEELNQKILDYLLKTSKSPSLLDEEEDKNAKDFFVFFSEN